MLVGVAVIVKLSSRFYVPHIWFVGTLGGLYDGVFLLPYVVGMDALRWSRRPLIEMVGASERSLHMLGSASA